MENKLSKKEISDYLLTYALFYDEMCNNPLRKMKSTFKSIQLQKPKCDYSREYYDKMLNVHRLYNTLKEFSMEYDENSRYLTESILQTEINLEDIFINSDDSKKFSYKNTLKFIRNALNHSVDRDLYSIDGDGNMEIHLKNVKPQEFHVKLSCDRLEELSEYIEKYSEHSTVYMFNGLDKIDISSDTLFDDLDQLKIIRYYYKSKNSDNLSVKLKKIQSEDGQEAMDQYLEDSVNNGLLLKREYLLDKKQKEYLTTFLGFPFNKECFEVGDKELYKEMVLADCIKYMIPFGPLKRKIFNDSVWIDKIGLSNWNNSFQSLIDYSDKLYINDMKLMGDRLDVCSYDKITCNYFNYVSFVFDNVNKFDKTNIDGVDVDLERVRNSCVHGRWGVFSDTINNEYRISLYDWPNGIEHENVAVWHRSFSFETLLSLANKIMYSHNVIENTKEEIKNKFLVKSNSKSS